jgi:hypothetical protein
LNRDIRISVQWNRRELNPVAMCARHSSRPRAIPFLLSN